MDMKMLGVLKAKVVEWDGEMNEKDWTARTTESLLGLYVSQTFPHSGFLLNKLDEVAGHKVNADEIRPLIARLIVQDDRRLSRAYFNNNTVGICKNFRDNGLAVITSSEDARR